LSGSPIKAPGFAGGYLPFATVSSHATEVCLGELLKDVFRGVPAAQSSDSLRAGNPDAPIASGIYAFKDKQGSYTYKIRDIGNGRALVAFDGERTERNGTDDSVSTSHTWAMVTAGGANWTATQAENDSSLACEIKFVAHQVAINIQEHDCAYAGTVSPPKNTILKFSGPLKGDEFTDAEKKLGASITVAVRPNLSTSPTAPGASSPLVGRTFTGPHTVLDQFKNTQTLDFGGEGLSRRVVHVGELTGQKHVLVLINRGRDWIVSADLAIVPPTRGLNFVGTNDESDYAPAIRCTVDGQRAVVFGFLRPSGRTYLSANPDLVWSLDAAGRPVPVKGTQISCK